jgi:hypothetical protein
VISQKNIPSLDVHATQCMNIVHSIMNSEDKKELTAISTELLYNIAQDYLLMYKDILYSKQFPHRKFIQENRTKH